MTVAGAPPLAHLKYRADIDGLRAVAILAVVGYHAYPRWLPGGFIGVDIFFVISGYLISTIILENLRLGSFSFGGFYVRRVRRLFPAMGLMMLVGLVVGHYVLLPNEYQQLGEEVAGGAAFIANFVFWRESGYFDVAADVKPMLHLWSLGVEEQFYALWPVTLSFLWRRTSHPIVPTAALLAVSFTLNVGLVGSHPVEAFYAPYTRFWELLLGSCWACRALLDGGVAQRPSRVNDNLRAFAGAALLVAGICVIGGEQRFPGWWALLPTLGAVLIISAGPAAWLNRQVLGRSALVWFGRISFPLYLWHWPMLSFWRILIGPNAPATARAGVVLSSIGLAWLTQQLVERPLRITWPQRPAMWALSTGMSAVFVWGCLCAARELTVRMSDQALQPMVSAVEDFDYPTGLEKVHYQNQLLYRLNAGPDVTFMLGDSHIQQYSARAVELARRATPGLNTVYFGAMGGCAPMPHVFDDSDVHVSCAALRTAALDFIRKNDVQTVVVGACWNCLFIDFVQPLKADVEPYRYYYFDTGTREYFRGGRGAELAMQELGRLLRELSLTRTVYLLLDAPTGSEYNPKRYIAGNRISGLSLTGQIPSRAQFAQTQLSLNRALTDLARRSGAAVIDPAQWLCRDAQCQILTDDHQFIYMDRDHLRSSYVRREVTYLDEALVRRP